MSRTDTILMIMTSHAELGDTGKPTGIWLEEMTTPYYALIDAGFDVALAWIDGGAVPIDPRSLNESGSPASVGRFQADAALRQAVQETKRLEDALSRDYDALFLAGGHGTMWDFPVSDVLGAAVSKQLANNRFVVAICHGPAGLSKAIAANGDPIVKGREVAGFSNAEEIASGLDGIMPFALETRLRDLGARYVSGKNFAPFTVRDGYLITGQNPASADQAAALLMSAMRGQHATAPAAA